MGAFQRVCRLRMINTSGGCSTFFSGPQGYAPDLLRSICTALRFHERPQRHSRARVSASMGRPSRGTDAALQEQMQQPATTVSLEPEVPQAYVHHSSPQPYILGMWSVAVVAVATAVASICAAVMASVFALRPVLVNMTRAAAATEKAAVEMETAAKEWDRAALKFQAEVDLTMPEVAAASREFGALGRSVNTLGGLTTGGITRPMGLVQQTTSNSLRKVVNDVSQLTTALSPTMDEWRRRMSWMTQRFDALKNLNRPPTSPKEPLLGSQTVIHRQQQQLEQQSAPGRGQTASPMASLVTAMRKNAAASLDAEDDADADASFLAARSEARTINAAAAAAEQMADEATQMAADITASSPAADGAVHLQQELQQQARGHQQLTPREAGDATSSEGALSSGSGSCSEQQARGSTSDDNPLPLSSMTEEDVALLGRLKDRRSAAEDVYRALRRAEQAATAAAQASGVLENALQAAEHSGDFGQLAYQQQQLDDGDNYSSSSSHHGDMVSGYSSGSESSSEEGGKVSWLPLDGMAGSVGGGKK